VNMKSILFPIVFNKIIVAYIINGNPSIKKVYDMRLLKGKKQISKGDFISQEDLEQESDKW